MGNKPKKSNQHSILNKEEDKVANKPADEGDLKIGIFQNLLFKLLYNFKPLIRSSGKSIHDELHKNDYICVLKPVGGQLMVYVLDNSKISEWKLKDESAFVQEFKFEDIWYYADIVKNASKNK